MMPAGNQVLLTGATGFVGRHVHPILVRNGYRVVCGSRRPEEAGNRFPGRKFRYLDVGRPSSIETAIRGCSAAVYLIHSLAEGQDYESIERRGAENFRRIAEQHGLSRIVYLGGLPPRETPSRHLRSRLATGAILRAGPVSTLELQATMVIGYGSASWRIVRDLAARLPFMVVPSWLDNLSEPIAIDDVVFAIERALSFETQTSAFHALPGPEVLSGKEILERTARLLDRDLKIVRVPIVGPRLSSYWIHWVTRVDRGIAKELVEGLKHDLTAEGAGFWRHFPDHVRLSFDQAASRAIRAEARQMPWTTRAVESLLRTVGSLPWKSSGRRAASK